LIVGAWLVALGWLMLRQFGGSAPEEQVATTTIPPAATFFAVFAGTQQVGLASITTDTIARGIRVSFRGDVDVPLPVVPRRILTGTDAEYAGEFRLRGFVSFTSGEVGQASLQARVIGDTLLVATRRGGQVFDADTAEMRVPPGTVLPDALPLKLAAAGALEIGRRTDVPVLDPHFLLLRRLAVTVTAESLFVVVDSAAQDAGGAWRPAHTDTVRAWRAEWMDRGLPVVTWVDREGTVVQASTPLGLAWRETAFELANSGYVRRRPNPVRTAPLELVARPAPTPPSLTREVMLGEGLVPPAVPLRGPGQEFDGLTIVRTTETVPETEVPLPVRDSAVAAYLDERPDPHVTQLARLALRGTRDATEAARRLAAWVSGNITPGAPSDFIGLQRTLETRRGDSSDRAVMFVVMAQSVGLPARPVAGLVYAGGRFQYRAWAEVYVGGWLAVDPTLGQVPADANHIRLVTEGLARPAELVSLVGAVRPRLVASQEQQ
jgi:transglutaminase-like putative cysteine protease